MKGQVKALVVAMALAAGSANAAIDTATSGNGELYFTIWDSTSQKAYTKDLGIKMNDFQPGHGSETFSLVGDTFWTGFLSTANLATTLWMVGANDSTGGSVAGGPRYLSTSDNLTTATNQPNSNLSQFAASDSFLLAANAFGTHPTQANGSSLTAAADGNSYPGGVFNMDTWTNKAKFSAAGDTNSSLNFFALTTSSTNPVGKATITQFQGAPSQVATWDINVGTNTLSFNGVQPEIVTPIPAAAWLLGSALLGLVGVGRRQAKTNVIAA